MPTKQELEYIQEYANKKAKSTLGEILPPDMLIEWKSLQDWKPVWENKLATCIEEIVVDYYKWFEGDHYAPLTTE